jgi:tetratricopeptide (TPR) repeat protein
MITRFPIAATMLVAALFLATTAASQPKPTPNDWGNAFGSCLQGDPIPPEQRIAHCSRALQSRMLAPDEVARARTMRGSARAALGEQVMAGIDYREALRHYDSVIDPKSPDALALFRRGVARDGAGQTDQALNDFDAAIRTAPDEPRAYFERGVLLAGRKRAYDRAIADFNRALELEPRNIEALVRRGDAYGQIGDYGRGLADLNRAIGQSRPVAQYYVIRGLLNGRRNMPQLALADYNTALGLDPNNVDALQSRGAILAAGGQLDAALADLDAAIAVAPNSAIARYNRGYIRFMKGSYDPAIADFSAAIDLDPDLALAHNNRCVARAMAGKDLVAALVDCDAGLKLAPANLDVRVTRGFIYLKLGDPAIAIVEFDAALNVDPNRPLALYGRGAARIRMGQTQEGEADQAAARALDPSIEQLFARYGVN